MLRKFLVDILLVVVLVLLCGGLWWRVGHTKQVHVATTTYKTPEESRSVYVRFNMEAYDVILANFWKEATDTDMALLYQLSVQKALGGPTVALASSTRAGVATMLDAAFAQQATDDAKKELALKTLEVALYNLPPVGRNELLSSGQQTQLNNTVANINPEVDLYKNVGVEKGATEEQVQKAFIEKQKILQGTTSPQGKAELKQVTYAHGVLTSKTKKKLYDSAQIEPTVFADTKGQDTLYVYISKISPTTIGEFIEAVESASTSPELTRLVLDFRGNIGGDLSFTQNIMSQFIGPNAYVYDLYHQGKYDPQRTPNVAPLPALKKYTDIAVLIDNMTQSTAELTASALKRFRLAHIVGTTSRGWGSVEHEFILTTTPDPKEKFALLLVIDLTLGEGQQPIEQNGVAPDVDTRNAGWQKRLRQFFTEPFAATIAEVASKPPQR